MIQFMSGVLEPKASLTPEVEVYQGSPPCTRYLMNPGVKQTLPYSKQFILTGLASIQNFKSEHFYTFV